MLLLKVDVNVKYIIPKVYHLVDLTEIFTPTPGPSESSESPLNKPNQTKPYETYRKM